MASSETSEPKVTREEVEAMIDRCPTLAAIAHALGVHRATLYRAERRWGLKLPRRPSRARSRDEWKALIVEHGLSVPALAQATGLRRDWVRECLIKHGLILTYWAWRNRRYAEWTGDENSEESER